MLKDVVIIGDEMMSRQALFEKGLRATSALLSIGIGPEDPVALLMRNTIAFFEASRGIGGTGGYAVPLNWHNKTDEIDYIMKDARPKALVGHSDILLGVRDAIPPGIPVFLVPVDGQPATNCAATREALQVFHGSKVWEDWISGFEPYAGEPRVPPAAILYTSGTTGHPKAVRKPTMTPAQMAKFRKFIFDAYGIGPGARVLVLGPLYHASPDAAGRFAVNEADIAVLQPKFDAEGMLKLIEEHRITHISTVPTVFVRLLKLPPEVRARYDVSSLRQVSHTGGPCPVDVKRQMIDWFGPVIHEIYGGTEQGITFSCDSATWLTYPGTVGLPLEGTRYAIIGENGERLGPNEVGEIYARNDAFGDFTYVGRPDARAECEIDTMITLGDMGYVNEDGALYLCDRKKDMVISGGVNIYPAETEMALLSHPDVQDCAVFGIPDDEMGESLMAAVQLKPGAQTDAESIRSWLKQRLTGYKVPRAVTFHDTLPREDSGKIFKRKLRSPYWEGRERAI
ncbi:AMP-binding protein [Seohaeicola nanhaiensis]|uniref:AMP-binding protein n=1 Tax=Seohaeicola nanhaiensis TaxID=1387282 RepID=A0ABV9KKW5_9RHOB